MTQAALAAAEPAPVINRQAILDLLEGDADLLREIVVLFLESCPQRLARARVALAEGNPRNLALAAHSLRGSLANFVATAAVAAALRLELLARRGDLTGAPETLADLEREIARLQPALAELTQQGAGSARVELEP